MKYVSAVGLSVAALFALFAGPVLADGGAWGEVKGRIVLDAPKAPAPIAIAVDKDQGHCLAKGKLYREDLVVNPKNMGLRWVFVWLAPEKGEPTLKIHPSLQEIKDKTVEVDQPCCQFVPHNLALREGQTLLAKNSAPVAHNVHWLGGLKNPGGNQIVPAGGKLPINGLVTDRSPVKLQCDIHGWMAGWVRIFDHPYFAVTDPDGNFEIKLAPAGKYRLVIWQDNGWGTGLRDGQPITIDGGKITDKGDIKYKPPE